MVFYIACCKSSPYIRFLRYLMLYLFGLLYRASLGVLVVFCPKTFAAAAACSPGMVVNYCPLVVFTMPCWFVGLMISICSDHHQKDMSE